MSQTQPVMPLFYTRPEALQPERHGSLGLKPEPDFGFAARAVSVPISAAEAPFAARHYPIVFATAGEFLPLAVLGLSTGKNLFVDATGTWEPGVYIPSYVRRYPFVFATDEDQGRLTLCVDRAAGRITQDGGEKLFEDGKPTRVTDNALEFCAAFEREIVATRKIVELLRQHALLTENQATLTLPSGSKVALKDFMVIDAAAVDRLSNDAFAQLRHNGALPLIFAQIASRAGWGDLARRLPEGRHAAETAV